MIGLVLICTKRSISQVLLTQKKGLQTNSCFLVFSKFFTDVLESQREGLLFHLHTFPELSLFKHFFYLSLVFTTTAISICKYNLTCFLRPCGIFPNKIQQESKLIFELVIDLYLIS